MKQFTKFVILNYLYWMLVFFIHRIIFYTEITERASDSSAAFFHALRLDTSMAAYFMLIPCILFFTIQKISQKSFLKLLNVYSFITLLFVSLIELASIPIFFEWENTIDARAMSYLTNPSEVFMNIGLFFDLGHTLLFTLIFYFAYRIIKWINRKATEVKKNEEISIIHLILAMALLLVFIRSGFQKIPIKVSSAFFSNTNSSNFIAVNKSFYFIKSNLKNASEKLLSNAILVDTHKSYYEENFTFLLDSNRNRILNKQKPNIVLIILEGWPEEITALKSHSMEVTPGFNEIAQESYRFSNFYSSGFRTDQGFLSILSGLPSFSNLNILSDIQLSHGFPSLFNDFKKMNYYTAFHYGGDLQFSNMKRYLLAQDVDKLIQQYDFDNSEQSMSWGVPDGNLFTKSLEEMDRYNEPFFTSILTSSSHNPFDIPGDYKFSDETNRNKYLSSVYYTDQELKRFIDTAKTKDWYANTLFVILSDHGTKYLESYKINEHGRYKIPLLFYGNVLIDSLKHTVNSNLMNQYDLPNSLLSQYEKVNRNYPFSQNIFSPQSQAKAYWSRNNFSGFLKEKQNFVMNYKNKSIISSYPEIDPKSQEIEDAKYFMEILSYYIKEKQIRFK